MPKRFRINPALLVTAGVLISSTLIPVSALAASQDQVIAELQAQVAALTERLNSLEAKPSVPVRDYAPPAVTASSTSPSWTDRITLKGDFRYRHEYIDAQGADDRNRQRIRARPELKAQILDTVDVGFGLATGSGDPVSSNQTLGDGSSSKDINLDLAYVNWQTPIEGTNLIAGKFKNPIHRAGGNGLLWDSDLRPEGSAFTYQRGSWFATGVMLWAEEDSGNDDSLVWSGQAGWKNDFDNVNLLLGLGFTHFDAKGKPVPFDGDPRGNSVDALNNYLYDYQELELFAEARFSVADIPTMLFVDLVQNQDADNNDTGFAIGGTMKFQHKDHPWQVGYTYQDLQADAVFALWTDSDFIGGGTDGKGHIFRGSYSVTKAIALGSTLFINERGGDVGPWEDYNRLMLDVSFKY